MIRTAHGLDIPHPTIPGARKKTIRNWMNYRTPGSEYNLAKAKAISAQGDPPDWVGAFDFSFTSLESALQVFARDSMDVGNRAMVGVRHSENPSAWLNMKAINGSAVDAVITEEGSKITYPGLWPGCDLVYEIFGATLKETVVVWDKSISPAYFEWSLKYGPGFDLSINDSVMRLFDTSTEDCFIRSQYPTGWDSATLGPYDGKQKIRCTLTEQSSYQGNRVIRLTPNVEDMAVAIGIVYLDPPLTVDAAGDIDDNTMYSAGFADQDNNGSSISIKTEPSSERRGLLRIADSALPEGDYSQANLEVYTNTATTVTFYRILPAAAAWIEGNKVGSEASTGESNWLQMNYNETNWPGSAGCSTSGTDFTTTDSTTSGTTNAGNWNTIGLDTGIFSDWSQGVFANGGYVVTSSANNSLASSDNGSVPLYFELVYTEVSSGLSYFFVGFQY